MVYSAFEEGHSIWYFRAYDYAGVNKETGAAQFRNHEGKIVSSSELSDQDMTDIGSAIPKFTYGLTINLEYKGWDFSVFGTGVGGNNDYQFKLFRPLTCTIEQITPCLGFFHRIHQHFMLKEITSTNVFGNTGKILIQHTTCTPIS